MADEAAYEWIDRPSGTVLRATRAGVSVSPQENPAATANVATPPVGQEILRLAGERAAIVAYLRHRGFVSNLADLIEQGAHHATLQEAHGPSSNPPDSEASADSCERKGGTESPDTSG
jgi:hypothetical protein